MHHIWLILVSVFMISAASARQVLVIAVGLDRVSPKYYLGWEGVLDSCVRDAKIYRDLVPDGPTVSKVALFNEQATRESVVAAIRQAAGTARAGDLVVIGYSGHGQQVEDYNGDEASNAAGDKYDEAWCLYNGLLVDDELYHLWSEFQEGVEILVIADMCHAGTTTKSNLLETWSKLYVLRKTQRAEAEKLRILLRAAQEASLARVPSEKLKSSDPALLPKSLSDASIAVPELSPNPATLEDKQMDLFLSKLVNRTHAQELAEQQSGLSGRNEVLKASVFLFAACRDDQTAVAIGGAPSLFTGKLAAVWNGGKFTGNCLELVQAVSAAIIISYGREVLNLHTPQYYLFGKQAPILAEKRPFQVEP